MAAVSSGRQIGLVFVSLLLDLLAFTLILPLLPRLLDHYSRHDTSGVYPALLTRVVQFQQAVGAPHGVSGVLVGGALGSMFSLLQFLAAPITGRLSDRHGRRPLLLFCLTGIAASHLLWYCAASFPVFVAARVLCGLSKGNVNLASAIVADVTDVEGRGRGMAWIGVAFSLGFIVGPMVGGILAGRYGGGGAALIQVPALLALTLSLLNWLFVALLMPESLPAERRCLSATGPLSNYTSPTALLQFRAVHSADRAELAGLRRVGLVYFLYLLIFSGVEFTLTFHCHARFQFTAVQQGYMFLYLGAVMALVQGGLVRRLRDDQLERWALLGVSLLLPCFLLLAHADSLPVLAVGLLLYGLSTAVCVPCMSTLAARYGGAQQRGVVTGVFRSLGALARAVGPLLASSVFWLYGVTVCYSLAALATVIPIALMATFQSTAAPKHKSQ